MAEPLLNRIHAHQLRPVLTQQERDVLILSIQHADDSHQTNLDLARRAGLSVEALKATTHRACTKLGAHSRRQAIILAVQRGEIRYDELLQPAELAATLSQLGPVGLRRIARLVRQRDEDGYLPDIDERIIPVEHRADSQLTHRERDVLILTGRGMTNREMAETLCMSVSAVRAFLSGACAKLGASGRDEAVMLALTRGDVGMGEMYTAEELLRGLGRLGADALDKIAQQLEATPSPEPALD